MDINSIKRAITKFVNAGGLCRGVSIVGCYATSDDYVVPWLLDACQKNNIEITETDDIYTLFEKIKEQKGSHKKLYIFEDGETTLFNQCYVGININELDERYSLLRMKIDVRNELEKIGFLDASDEPNMVGVFGELILLPKEANILNTGDADVKRENTSPANT